ncbi:MAG: MSMEG_4193 family putative phosphomutase [Dermatophilaceae bacterium]
MATVLIVRHGRTHANAAGVLPGWAPGVRLDETGRAQATALGQRLVGSGLAVCRVVTSPLPRCVQTAELLAHPLGEGLPVLSDERLAECRFGAWTGRTLADLAGDPLWRVVQDQPSAAVFPDGPDFAGESLAAMAARVVAAVREHDAAVTAQAGPGAVWVAVSHGDPVKALLADALGLHLDLFQRITVDPASVSVVRYGPRRPFVVRVNDVGGDLGGVLGAPDGGGDAAVGGGAGAPAPAG